MREGGTPKADESTDKLRECDSDKGGGESKNPKILLTSFKYGPYEWSSRPRPPKTAWQRSALEYHSLVYRVIDLCRFG